MRVLSLQEILELHRQLLSQSGGLSGILNESALLSALSQPYATFGGKDLYPTVVEKAAALGYFLIHNHPFADGNKRTGHAAMELLLLLHGLEIDASVDEQEQICLEVASGSLSREKFTQWLSQSVRSWDRSKTH